MSKKGYSRPGLFGTMKHYDADGNFIERAVQDGLAAWRIMMPMEIRLVKVVQAGLEVWKIMMLMETK